LRQALVEQGLRFFRNFIDEDNPDPAVRFESARAYGLMGTVYCSQHKLEDGQAMLRKKFALLEGLVGADPDNYAYRREQIRTRNLMGLMYTSLGHPREAREEYARTAELHRQALPHDVGGAALSAYAWFLVDCPDVTLRDSARAVSLAGEAVLRDPGKATHWNVLGIARYQAGDWAAAVEALEKSMALDGGGDPWDWFYLAMACWRQGDRDRARAWYARSIRWMEEHPPIDESLIRYRKEADALFGE